MSKKKGAVAYVDGSYNQAAGICGYGIVFFDQDGSDPELISGNCYGGSWNVSGEIVAALEAVRKALSYGCESIDIFHEEADRLAKQGAGIKGKKRGQKKNSKPNPAVIPADGLNLKCRVAIERFARISAPKFNDYRQLKTYGLDKFSKKPVGDLEKLLGQEVCDTIRQEIHDSNDYASALRWAARGLPPEEAAHKANVDMEVRNNCTYR